MTLVDKGNTKLHFFFSIFSQRHSLQHPRQAKKSDTGRHSGNGDASQVLEVKRVKQVLGVRVDVDGLLLDSRDLVIDVKRKQEPQKESISSEKYKTLIHLSPTSTQ